MRPSGEWNGWVGLTQQSGGVGVGAGMAGRDAFCTLVQIESYHVCIIPSESVPYCMYEPTITFEDGRRERRGGTRGEGGGVEAREEAKG